MNITKSNVLAEVQVGGTVTEISKRMGIPVAKLREAAKAFNINLRNKPRKEYNFVDDTEQDTIQTTIPLLLSVEDDEAENVSTKMFADSPALGEDIEL